MSKPKHPPKPPGTGKLANDRNKTGQTAPTQRHESQRSPLSRSDREALAGSHNQSQMRRGTGTRGRG